MPASAAEHQQSLPYDFDLLYDFKTVGQLHDHLTGHSRMATSATDAALVELALEHGVALPSRYVRRPLDLATRYGEAIQLLEELLEHLSPTSVDDRAAPADSAWMQRSIKELLDRHAPLPPGQQKDST